MRPLVVAVAALLMAGPSATADVVPITEACPVPAADWQYDAQAMSYQVQVPLTGCPWYDGRPVLLHGSITRTDVLGQQEAHVVVRCEPGAPASEGHGAHQPPLVPPPPSPVAQEPGPGSHADEVRPADHCLLAVHLSHPPVERATYKGQLTYPADGGERTERISLECLSVATDMLSGCRDA